MGCTPLQSIRVAKLPIPVIGQPGESANLGSGSGTPAERSALYPSKSRAIGGAPRPAVLRHGRNSLPTQEMRRQKNQLMSVHYSAAYAEMFRISEYTMGVSQRNIRCASMLRLGRGVLKIFNTHGTGNRAPIFWTPTPWKEKAGTWARRMRTALIGVVEPAGEGLRLCRGQVAYAEAHERALRPSKRGKCPSCAAAYQRSGQIKGLFPEPALIDPVALSAVSATGPVAPSVFLRAYPAVSSVV
jgi:hypothetical protein